MLAVDAGYFIFLLFFIRELEIEGGGGCDMRKVRCATARRSVAEKPVCMVYTFAIGAHALD